MRLFQAIFFIYYFSHPIATTATPVKGISDIDAGFKGVERIDFECPPNQISKILKPNQDTDDQEIIKSCWVDFHPTYLNVMNKQSIKRDDVISFFQSPPVSGKCCASWNLIYKDKEGAKKMLSMRRNDLPFPLTKRKLKRLGTPANIINRWLAQ